VIHDPEPLAEGHGLLLVVGDHDEGDAEPLLNVEQLELGVLAQLLVERGERLIEQQQLRALDERARERDALALTAGELVRLARAQPPHLHDVEDLADLAADGVALDAFLLEAEGDVLLDAHVRKERVGLEHHVDRALIRRDGSHVDAIDVNGASARTLEARQHAQQCGLPGSRAAQQAEDLAATDIERNVIHRHEVAEPLGHVADAHIGRGRVGARGSAGLVAHGQSVAVVHCRIFTYQS